MQPRKANGLATPLKAFADNCRIGDLALFVPGIRKSGSCGNSENFYPVAGSRRFWRERPLTSEAEVSWLNAPPAAGPNDGARVLPEMLRFGWAPSNCRPNGNREGTKNEKGRRFSDFSADRRLFYSPGCCRSAVSGLLPALVAGSPARLQEDASTQNSEKICLPFKSSPASR